MRRSITLIIVLTLFISAFANVNDNSYMIKLFREYARYTENVKTGNVTQEYLRSAAKVEREIDDIIDELIDNNTELDSFIAYLYNKKDADILAFQKVVEKVAESLGVNMIAATQYSPAKRNSLNQLNVLLDKMRAFSNIQFAKTSTKDTSLDEKYIKLVKSIYSYNINPEKIDSSVKMSKGWATDVSITLAKDWNRLSEDAKKTIKNIPRLAFFKGEVNEEVAENLDTIEVFTHRTDNFIIKYSKSGKNAVLEPETDEDSNNVPDYVDNVGKYLEKALKYEVEELGFIKPYKVPEFEVLITNMRDYGIIVPNYDDPNKQDCFMQLDNDYSGDNFVSKGLEGAKVTCAHELFHAIQAMYGLFTNEILSQARWLPEGTAVWMEEAVFDEVNDYISYINGSRNVYFDEPESPIFRLYPHTSYIAFMWYEFLTSAKLFTEQKDVAYINGNHILKALWEDVKANNYSPIEAHLNVFKDKFAGIFKRFSVARYTKANFRDKDLWERELKFAGDVKEYPFNKTVEEYGAPQVFGANYVRFNPLNITENSKLNIRFSSDYAYPVSIICKTDKGERIIDVKPGKTKWELPLKRFGKKYREVVVIIYNIDRFNTGIPYEITGDIID